MTEYSKNITIAVADDEEIVVSLVHDALEDDGYKILTATDTYDCLNLFETEKIDLLISDIRMPKMNGIELVKKARAIQPDIQVIFMTGYANLNSAKDAIKQGASDYILKPFELHEIRQAVTKAVGQIEREAKVVSTEKQIDHLSDLNEILFNVGDKLSQIQMSLKFAVIHFQSTYGSFLYWNSDRSIFKMITLKNDQFSEHDLDQSMMNQILDKSDFQDFKEPIIIGKNIEHPFLKNGVNPEESKLFIPDWKTDENKMVVIRVNRQLSIYGLIMLEIPVNSETAVESNYKFLTITTHQLAMSLENLELLKESQNAYKKLKQLQDDTINLEKMATRGEMSAEIGHELNNFLGVVVGSLSLLEHQIKMEKYENVDKHLHAMHTNIDKIKKFTSNLMELRPISTKAETICFRRLLKEVIEYLMPQKRYQGVQINYNTNGSSIPFEADSLHIQQLLYNVFNNAADAMKDSEQKIINVHLETVQNRKSFTLCIQDTGSGIKPEYLEKAFNEKFTTKENGHGFGLLVCKRIIESHSGTLNIESEFGQGTKLSIEFPIQPVIEPAKAEFV